MAKSKQIIVKESISDLKKLYKEQPTHLKDRIRLLLYIKQQGNASKQVIAEAIMVSHTSVQTWRKMYEQGGIAGLLQFKRHSNNPSVITPAIHEGIRKRLSNPKEAPTSYTELCEWVIEQNGKAIHYQTLNGYVKRKFKAKLKVARKSHIDKDPAEEAVFKKPC